MKGAEGSSLPPGTVTVTDPRQAEVVTNRTELRRLKPFMERECTVGQAAQALGLGLGTVFKLAQRYSRLGLLTLTRTEPRDGRALRYYRAPPAFFVPLSVRGLEQVGERNRSAEVARFEANLSRVMRESLGARWGTLSAFTPSGETYLEIVSDTGEVFEPLDDGAPLILAGWNRLPLTLPEARALQRGLVELILPYLGRAAPEGTELYQVGVLMVREGEAGEG